MWNWEWFITAEDLTTLKFSYPSVNREERLQCRVISAAAELTMQYGLSAEEATTTIPARTTTQPTLCYNIPTSDIFNRPRELLQLCAIRRAQDTRREDIGTREAGSQEETGRGCATY